MITPVKKPTPEQYISDIKREGRKALAREKAATKAISILAPLIAKWAIASALIAIVGIIVSVTNTFAAIPSTLAFGASIYRMLSFQSKHDSYIHMLREAQSDISDAITKVDVYTELKENCSL